MNVNINNTLQAIEEALAFLQNEKPLEAARLCDQILAADPENIQAHFLLGNALRKQGKNSEAVESFQNALHFKHDSPEILNNLGNTLKDLMRYKEASSCFQKILSIKPNYYNALLNYGNLLREVSNLTEAAACYHKAISLQPQVPDAYNNLGRLLVEQRRYEQAAACFNKVLSLDPSNALTLVNLGIAYIKQGEYKNEIASLQKALSIQPEYVLAYNELGNIFRDIGMIDEALISFRNALSIDLDYWRACRNSLFTMNFIPEITQEEIYSESLQLGTRYVNKVLSNDVIFNNTLESGRRLKIGYVSGDFRKHSMNYFFEPLIKDHNRKSVEVFCYSNVKKTDSATENIKGYADHWRTIAMQNDEQVVKQIQKDKIDILVDLSGHTAHNRLMVFAKKPAPVQVTWLGYVNTTGLQTIDYHFVDSIVMPEGEEKGYSEQMIHLPACFVCFNPPADAPKIVESPVVKSGMINFGSVNSLMKINPAVVALWADILKKVGNSRLLFQAIPFADQYVTDRFIKLFKKQGISTDRVEFIPSLNSHEFLKLHNRIDIALDPFPFNGLTTTCNTLWMGVPVVTLRGNRFSGRVAASVLSVLGLNELISETRDEYIAKAVALASDSKRLNELRIGMRDRMLASPLCDSIGFAQNFEKAYSYIWQQYIESQLKNKK